MDRREMEERAERARNLKRRVREGEEVVQNLAGHQRGVAPELRGEINQLNVAAIDHAIDYQV